MFSFRPLATYLVLTAMLLSNAAGWLHVGCCETTGCAAVECDDSLSADAVETAACCSHCHSHDAAPVGDSSETPRESVPVAPEHDSDSCSICQSFYDSRYAIVTLGETFVRLTLPVIRVGAFRECVTVEPTFLNDLSVRGPPNASTRLSFS